MSSGEPAVPSVAEPPGSEGGRDGGDDQQFEHDVDLPGSDPAGQEATTTVDGGLNHE